MTRKRKIAFGLFWVLVILGAGLTGFSSPAPRKARKPPPGSFLPGGVTSIDTSMVAPLAVRLTTGTAWYTPTRPTDTQPVSGTFWQATQPVSGTFWQATQPVSGTVAVSNLPATQPVSGTVTANVGTLPTLTKGAQGATGYSVQELKDAGRSSVMVTAEAVAGSASEALVTMTISRSGGATTTGTSLNVTAGKTLRITSIVASFVSTTTTANTSRLRLRVNAGGAAIITSPLQMSFRVGWPSATFAANEANTVALQIPDGYELPAGAGLAITHLEAAANGTLDISVQGYEY